MSKSMMAGSVGNVPVAAAAPGGVVIANGMVISSGVPAAGVPGVNTAFAPTSRYYATETAALRRPDGQVVAYLRRRFVPAAERFALWQEHAVVQGDRLDNVTAKYLADPEQFWRVCDGNDAMRPDELCATVGRRLRITLPEGVPAATLG